MNCPHLEYHNPEERLALIEHLFRECQSSSRKLTRKNPNNLSHISAWVHNEFFYSNYERPYFDENDFKELLDCVDMPNSELTHGDFRLIQKCMGKPRLFTQAYITEERLSLEDTRDIARSYSGTLNVILGLCRSASSTKGCSTATPTSTTRESSTCNRKRTCWLSRTVATSTSELLWASTRRAFR